VWLHANRVARISDEETKLPMFNTSWKSFEAEGLILVLHYSKSLREVPSWMHGRQDASCSSQAYMYLAETRGVVFDLSLIFTASFLNMNCRLSGYAVFTLCPIA
jgi:hypothetical protein